MRATYAALAGTLTVLCLTAAVVGQNRPAGPDWPQWRGPNRDGSLATFAAPPTWPENLTRRWKVEVGTGYATPIVVANRVYAFSRQDEDEVMRALDAETGKTIWETRYATQFKMNPATARHGPGPKSTPTFADGRLFTLGMTGIVTAFDAATGKQLWQSRRRPLNRISTPRNPRWWIAGK
jgi:outer membrane protein assembly factor BamB